MKINGKEVHNIEDLDCIYPKIIKPKREKCEKLSDNGYVFFAANNSMIDIRQRWQRYNPVLVADSNKRNPRHLWAIKPVN